MHHHRIIDFVLVVVIAGVTGCGSDPYTTAPAPPPLLTVESGNNQSATRAKPLPAAIVVSLRGSDGVPVPDQEVDWRVLSGGGTLSQSTTHTDATGRTSVDWTLGDSIGPQTVLAAMAVWNAGIVITANALPNTVVAVHYDGSSWTSSLAAEPNTFVSLNSVWGVSSSQVIAVGSQSSGSFVTRYNGTAWTSDAQPLPSFVALSVSGSSMSDVFMTGFTCCHNTTDASIEHFDGSSWKRSNYRSWMRYVWFRAISSRATNDVFVVGDSGSISWYNGTFPFWWEQTTPTTQSLRAVWSDKNSAAAFAVGNAGTILYYDGATWTAQTSGTNHLLLGVWGTSASDVFAVGGSGVILHYDGTAWSAQTSGTTRDLYAVWGNSATSVFAVGDSSTILHFDGTTWSSQAAGASVHFRGIWGSSGSDVFAVGEAAN